MIKTFADRETEKLYLTGRSIRFPAEVRRAGIRKLDYLNAAKVLKDLRVPPGNRLKALKGDMKGKYSIRINDQYRAVFAFRDGDAYEVEIIDYH